MASAPASRVHEAPAAGALSARQAAMTKRTTMGPKIFTGSARSPTTMLHGPAEAAKALERGLSLLPGSGRRLVPHPHHPRSGGVAGRGEFGDPAERPHPRRG